MMTLALVAAIGTKAQKEVAAPQNVYARQTMSLNGEWNYFADLQEQGYYDYRMNPTQWGYFINAKPKNPSDLVEYDFDACPTMHVPGDWNTQDEQLFLYEGTIWMKRDFTIDNGQRTADDRLWAIGRIRSSWYRKLALSRMGRKADGCPHRE